MKERQITKQNCLPQILQTYLALAEVCFHWFYGIALFFFYGSSLVYGIATNPTGAEANNMIPTSLK